MIGITAMAIMITLSYLEVVVPTKRILISSSQYLYNLYQYERRL
jgi:hypothetical protein